MTSRMMCRIGLVAVIALGATSCAAPTPTPAPTASPVVGARQISLANDTTVAITVIVNGTVAATVPPDTTAAPIAGALPARPWTVEARSPSGRVLATLTVGVADNISATAGVGAFGDVACGHVTLWAGGVIPDHPIPSQASPQPCD